MNEKFEDLKKVYLKLRSEFDKPGDSDLIKLQKDTENLKAEVEKQVGVKTPIKEIPYHVEQIQKALGKIRVGVDATHDVEDHLSELKKLFGKVEEAKDNIKELLSDLEDLEKDIDWEKNKKKTSNIIRRAHRNMASHT